MPAVPTLSTLFPESTPADVAPVADADASAAFGLLASRAFWLGGLLSALGWAGLLALLLR